MAKTTWKFILREIVNWPLVRTGDVSKEFDISKSHASIVLNRMHTWGYLSYYDIKMRGYRGDSGTSWARKDSLWGREKECG